ncbi:competence type IV pilus minor pilin ComGG [Bacillus sp. cl95]|uniref:competence type IV pilus minor pilin ComGG n=1 Tax=Bacillus sp. cl95 TaxID=1761761 RepID=UPI001C31768A|nr:competence type IV pilus minor pilin ComGG [Bacillus sp. cl95]
MVLLTLFLIIFTVSIEQLLLERKMLRETRTILTEEHYLLNSLTRLEKDLQSGSVTGTREVHYFKDGRVECTIDNVSSSQKKISLTVILNSGAKYTSHGYYDINLKKVVKWMENN